ncbi:pyruvate kinase [Pseudomonadota bacterium]
MSHPSSHRKTKVIATIGPACDNVETLKEMIHEGMSVARLNLSFGSGPDQVGRVKRIRQAAEECGQHVAIMGDTRGIEIRTGKLEEDSVDLKPNCRFDLYGDEQTGNVDGVSVTYRRLYTEVEVKSPILLDDGAIELEVTAVQGTTIQTRVINGGTLRANKGVNLPETQLSLSAVSPETREVVDREMAFVAENGIEFIAASFIQTADDIHRLREMLTEKGVETSIIAKIENRAGVHNQAEIIEAADGIMVARGDLGVELPLADVPAMQKSMICATVSAGKPVITATQMLASMEKSSKPSRAEASDVANAILDGTSAVMLSGETAIGRYPVEAVRTMAKLAERAEASLGKYGLLQKITPNPSNKITEAVSQAAITMASHLRAAAIFCLTDSGFTARQISKLRPSCPILAVTISSTEARKLAMNWGVRPLLHQGKCTDEAKVRRGIERAKELGYLESGDVVLITAGQHQVSGGTDYIRVLTIE